MNEWVFYPIIFLRKAKISLGSLKWDLVLLISFSTAYNLFEKRAKYQLDQLGRLQRYQFCRK